MSEVDEFRKAMMEKLKLIGLHPLHQYSTPADILDAIIRWHVQENLDSADLRPGAKAMMEALRWRAANHYHARPSANAICIAENELVLEWAEDAYKSVTDLDYHYDLETDNGKPT